jgi:CRP/FNR family transcriptional regulator, cyclic AMP receptor protein
VTGSDGAPSQERLLERLSTFALFADLSRSQLSAIAHEFEEAYFARDERVLRRDLHGSGFYLILEGSATVSVNGHVQNRLIPGDFFGEISVLLDVPPSADVVAETELRCLILPAASLERILVAHPRLALRMLQVEARRLRATTEGRG